MKKTLSRAALGLFLAVAMIASPAGAVDAGAKAAFERAGHDFVSGWNAHNAKKMAAVWWEEADLINPFDRAAKGRDEIEKLFMEEQSGPMKASTYKIESSTMREFGRDAVVGDWTSTLTGILGADGKVQPPFPHHVTIVLVKIADKWEVVSARGFIFAAKPPAAKK